MRGRHEDLASQLVLVPQPVGDLVYPAGLPPGRRRLRSSAAAVPGSAQDRGPAAMQGRPARSDSAAREPIERHACRSTGVRYPRWSNRRGPPARHIACRTERLFPSAWRSRLVHGGKLSRRPPLADRLEAPLRGRWRFRSRPARPAPHEQGPTLIECVIDRDVCTSDLISRGRLVAAANARPPRPH